MVIDAAGGKVGYGFTFTAATLVVAGIMALTWPTLKTKQPKVETAS
jgi:hypothetical protein